LLVYIVFSLIVINSVLGSSSISIAKHTQAAPANVPISMQSWWDYDWYESSSLPSFPTLIILPYCTI
jgi:hypothetical protein